MTRVAIVTDSSADLAPSVAAGSRITVVPAAIRLGASAVRGRAASLWGAEEPREVRQPVDTPPQPELIAAFAAAFAELASTHDAVVAVLLSSRLSGNVAAMTAGATVWL